MPLADLSAEAGCSPSRLRRIMRYLTHRGFFKQEQSSTTSTPSVSYAATPLSRLLLQKVDNSTAAFLLMMSSPEMIAPWHSLSSRMRVDGVGESPAAFEGQGLWEYMSRNPAFSKLFNDAMACHARLAVSDILHGCPEIFEGVGSLVDVGGGDGTALGAIVKACPWIRGFNLDQPHVVAVAPRRDGVEHVGGDMFQQVPKADAVFIMCVLHDWSDEECIEILKKCREAVPEERGKVMIVEAVVREGEEDDKYGEVRLGFDLGMLAYTDGRERSMEEWEYVVNRAGFSSFTVKDNGGIWSVILAYP